MQHSLNLSIINVKDVDHKNLIIDQPFIALVPTYLDGGNGIDKGDVEILTTPLRNLIDRQDHAKFLVGVIGSGNKNFGHQYCLTAKQYAERFQKPLLADYELRGTDDDVRRIADIILKTTKKEDYY